MGANFLMLAAGWIIFLTFVLDRFLLATYHMMHLNWIILMALKLLWRSQFSHQPSHLQCLTNMIVDMQAADTQNVFLWPE